jgi:hypothetical protein
MNRFTASQDLFDDAVRLERIFLRYEPKVVSSDSCTYTGLVQDQIATQLLGQQWSDYSNGSQGRW